MRRLSTPFIEPLTRVFHNPLRRASSEESSTTLGVAEGDDAAPEADPPQRPVRERSTELTFHETNAPASRLLRATSDADLPLRMQDMLYVYQLTLSKPLLLSPLAFHTADIVWRYKDSQRTYKTLQKKKIITEAGTIKTSAITKSFAHHFAYLSAFAQRRIIGLLFWWEEEVQRLRSLLDQEADIKQLLSTIMDDNGGPESMSAVLRTELARTRMLIHLKPSERTEVEDNDNEPLPAYTTSPLHSPPEEVANPLAPTSQQHAILG